MVGCGVLDSNTNAENSLLLQKSEASEESTEKTPGLFAKLFGKKEEGSAVGNTLRDKTKRENTIRDFMDLGALFGLTNASSGQSAQDFERQRQLEFQRMQEMERRNQQANILGIPVWAFVLIVAVVLLLSIVIFSKLKSS